MVITYLENVGSCASRSSSSVLYISRRSSVFLLHSPHVDSAWIMSRSSLTSNFKIASLSQAI